MLRNHFGLPPGPQMPRQQLPLTSAPGPSIAPTQSELPEYQGRNVTQNLAVSPHGSHHSHPSPPVNFRQSGCTSPALSPHAAYPQQGSPHSSSRISSPMQADNGQQTYPPMTSVIAAGIEASSSTPSFSVPTHIPSASGGSFTVEQNEAMREAEDLAEDYASEGSDDGEPRG